jgi:UDP-N-acetyl-D-galactosamine dehydrogenase
VIKARETALPATFDINNLRIGIVGLGYVGLPLAVEFGKKYPTVGFDINTGRIAELENREDSTLECSSEELAEAAQLSYTSDVEAIRDCNFYIVTVPTPIGDSNRPLLTPLRAASNTLSGVVKKGDIVVYESTVYPGATEEFCVPLLEKGNGLKMNEDFFVGYSPERINPGDKEHRLPTILKVTSGSTEEAAEFIDRVYASIITAGTHKASSIKVAEAAKVIENTQRDVNIALINELAMIFERVGIDTEEVLEAAGTKWNFLPFRPGLVGGHCIGVDPYYLMTTCRFMSPRVLLNACWRKRFSRMAPGCWYWDWRSKKTVLISGTPRSWTSLASWPHIRCRLMCTTLGSMQPRQSTSTAWSRSPTHRKGRMMSSS